MSCYKDHIKGEHHGCWNCRHQTKSSTEEFRGVKPRCKNCVHLMQHCQWEKIMTDVTCCPKCKSSNYYTGSPVEFDYEGFFTEWHCEDCGHTAPIEEKEQ